MSGLVLVRGGYLDPGEERVGEARDTLPRRVPVGELGDRGHRMMGVSVLLRIFILPPGIAEGALIRVRISARLGAWAGGVR